MNRRFNSRPVRRSRGLVSAALESLEMRRLLNAAIIVNTTDDTVAADAFISLREAVTMAEAVTDDTITFDPTVFTQGSLHTITLGSGQLNLAGGTGKLTIQGPGTDVLAIDGASASRIFKVNGTADVTITDLQINNGQETQVGGGILVNNNGKLALTNVTMSSNVVHGSNGPAGNAVTPGGEGGFASGGAIRNDGSTTLDNCSFTFNHVVGGNGGAAQAGGGNGGNAQGGAIYSSGTLVVDNNSAFDNNSATAGAGGEDTDGDSTSFPGLAQGGAILFDTASLGGITLSSFSGNSVTGGAGALSPATGGQGGEGFGGAVYSEANNLHVDQSTFSGNSATGGVGGDGDKGGQGGEGAGGAIDFETIGTLSNSSFDSNTATGGTVGLGLTAFDGASAQGGAVASFTNLSITDCDFTTNTANGADATPSGAAGGSAQGGGLFLAGVASIAGSTISSNTAAGGTSATDIGGQGDGGGICIEGSVTISDSTISTNFAVTGSSGDNVAGNSGFGGGISAVNGALNLQSSTVDHNFVTGGNAGDAPIVQGKSGGGGFGGGISSSASIAVTNSTIAFNTATGGNGGNAPGGTPQEGGAGAAAYGGGLYLETAVGNTILNSTIDSNIAAGGSGGGGDVGGPNGSGNGGNIASTEQLNPANTIISHGNADTGPDLFGTFAPQSSLITNTSGATVLGNNNLIGQDPILGVLGNNGGPTNTMLPDPDFSPAINKGDDSFALGFLTFDQRGPGFDRFVGQIDIGSVEVPPAASPVPQLTGNGLVIANNDSSPSSLDGTAFGTAKLGTPIDRTFTFTNIGNAPLNLGFIDLPFGFSVLTPFTSPVAPNDSTSFTVRFNPGLAGSYGGDVTVSDNEGNTLNHYVWNISGTALGDTIRVNFQPQNVEVPDGYLLDGGSTFAQRGNGFSYGWNASASSFTRDRDLLSDQRVDTLVHMQQYGARTWEMSLPNGTYQVHLVSGDASYIDSTYKINVEGVLTVNGKPTSGNHFVEGTKTVTVADGKLTISNASGSINNKIDYIEITPVQAPPPPTTIKVNFQTPASSTPSGYLADSGGIFADRGNGQFYGWNQSATSFTRDRNAGNSPDQKHDTLVHMQLYGVRTWEIAVPNGAYQVHIVAGDPSFTDSVYKINAEGILALTGTPNANNHWIEGTQTVTVADGKLTIANATGSVNNKLDYIEITPV